MQINFTQTLLLVLTALLSFPKFYLQIHLTTGAQQHVFEDNTKYDR